MPYTNDRIWDSRKGWTKRKNNSISFTNKGIVVKRIRPQLQVLDEDWANYDNAPVNTDWVNNHKQDWKQGYTNKDNPIVNTMKHIERVERFFKINNWLNKIPFVRVEVIE